jgi:molecular chaperone IbpA
LALSRTECQNFSAALLNVNTALLTSWPCGPFRVPIPRLSVVVASKGEWLWRHSISLLVPVDHWLRQGAPSDGFDQLPGLFSHALKRPETGYPPYNIEKVGEDQYRIVMAVAGISKTDVEIVQEQNRLSVRGKLKETNDLRRGIVTRLRASFRSRRVEVTDATMGEGLLLIDLKRELPEALKSRSIPINAGTFVPLGRKPAGTIEHQADDNRRLTPA